LIEIINKQLLLQLVGYLCYWQMGFNSVFKGLINSLEQRFPTCVPWVHFPGAPRPLQENKINKNLMKLRNKKQKVELSLLYGPYCCCHQ